MDYKSGHHVSFEVHDWVQVVVSRDQVQVRMAGTDYGRVKPAGRGQDRVCSASSCSVDGMLE